MNEMYFDNQIVEVNKDVYNYKLCIFIIKRLILLLIVDMLL
jgi:hypothetical protein